MTKKPAPHKTVLITGCSSGIGYDAAQTLRNRGWRVFASCRKPEDCARLQSEGFDSPLLDYENPESITQAVAEVLQATGGTLDAVFNNGPRWSRISPAMFCARSLRPICLASMI
jgi:NAD(P)-dependent dehydrogenase (short-subunit alcohol dehydrogenase family)